MPGSTRELGRGHVWHPLTLGEGPLNDPSQTRAETTDNPWIEGAAPLWCNLTSRWLATIEPAIGAQLDHLALAAMLGFDEPGSGRAARPKAPGLIGIRLGEADPASPAALPPIEFERWAGLAELEDALAGSGGRPAALVVGSLALGEEASPAEALDIPALRELCDRHAIPIVCDEAATLLPVVRGNALRRLRARVRLLHGLLAEIEAMDEVAAVLGRGLVGGIDLGAHDPALRLGHRVVRAARERDASIKALGDTVVLVPPLSIGKADLRALVEITAESIRAALEGAYGIRTPAEPRQLAPKPISHPLDVKRAA